MILKKTVTAALMLAAVVGFAQNESVSTNTAITDPDTPGITPMPVAPNSGSGIAMRRAGDAALTLGDYDRSLKEYAAYRAAAVARGDSAAIQDSFMRVINLHLRRNDHAAAENELKLFAETGADEFMMRAIAAEIAMVKQEYELAESELKALIAAAELPAYLRKDIDLALGETLMLSGKYAEAAALYRLMSRNAWSFMTEAKTIYALQLAGELVQSQEHLELLSRRELSSDERYELELLRVNQLLSEKRYTEARDGFRALPPVDPPDSRRYRIALELAMRLRQNENFTEAAWFLNEAFYYAAGLEERKYTLALMIDVEAQAANFALAAELMSRALALFPDNGDRFENKLQLARLLAHGNRLDGAAAAYADIVADERAPIALRVTAAREEAAVHGFRNDSAALEAALFNMAKAGAANVADFAEAHLLLADYYFHEGDFSRAADHAGIAAGENTAWRFPAFNRLMEAQAKLGDYKAALATAAKMKDEGVDMWPQKGAMAEARLLESAGNHQAAVNAYTAFALLWHLSPFAPEALYRAALLAHDYGDYRRAGELCVRLAQNYPDYEFADHALALAAYAEYLAGNRVGMDLLVEQLKNSYPGSNYTVEAQFWQYDLKRLDGDLVGAATLLEQMAERYRNGSAGVVEGIRYEQAMLAKLRGEYEAAAELFRLVGDSQAGGRVRALSLLELGDILMERGAHDEAGECFRRIGELAANSELALAALGRYADSLFSAGSLNRDKGKLAAAGEGYAQLLALIPIGGEVYYETAYKLGSVRNLLEGAEQAREMFNEILITAQSAAGKLTTGEAVWVAKAVEALISQALAPDSEKGIEEARRVINAAEAVDMPATINFEALKERINQKSQLKGV